MKNLFSVLLITIGLFSCKAVGSDPVSVGQRPVVAEVQDLGPTAVTEVGPNQNTSIVPFDSFPEEAREVIQKVFPGQDSLAVTTVENLLPNSTPVVHLDTPVTSEGNVDWSAFVGELLSGLGGVIGSEASPWLGLLALLLGFKRSRGHLANSVWSATRLELGDSAKSVGKAVGLVHTEPDDELSPPKVK